MKVLTMLAASTAVLLGAVSAQAVEVAALSGDNTISIIDTTAKKVTKTWKIQGISGRVLGMDVRPADGMLYAVGADMHKGEKPNVVLPTVLQFQGLKDMQKASSEIAKAGYDIIGTGSTTG